MLIKVEKYGAKVLRKHSALVKSDEDIEGMSTNLFDTLAKEGGIGLAAPQIGLLKRIFIMDSGPLANDDDTVDKFKHLIINPTILFVSKNENWFNEGCLSIPGIFEDVERPDKIVVKYYNEQLEPIERELSGIEARIFQHEYEHLEGILFIDKLSPIRRQMLKGKLNRIARATIK